MLHLITSQKDRNVNEILYDFNAEDIHDRSSAIKYRKKEIRL